MSLRYYSDITSILEMKFTTEQYEYIIKTKDKVTQLNKEQTKLYEDLLNNLNIPIQAEDWLFDYIYNDYGSIDDVEKRLTEIK